MNKNQQRPAAMHDERSLGLLLAVWLYRLLMAGAFAAGLALMQMTPMHLTFAEGAMVTLLYLALTTLLQSTYRACEVGQARVSEMMVSQLLSLVIASGAFYAAAVLYAHRLFSPLPLLAVFAVQMLVSAAWSMLANRLYFQRRRPLRAAVIYRDEATLKQLYASPYFGEKYEVITLLQNPEEDVHALRATLEKAGTEVVFTSGIPATFTNGIAKLCLEMGVKGYFVPHLGHIIMAGARYRVNFNVPMLLVDRPGRLTEYRALKRLFDLCASAAGLLLLSPLMAVIALLIHLEDRGPVFYRQVRLTRGGRTFNILKFRSMSVDAEKDGVARLAGENDSRITRVGRFLRSCRLDELPQLINILKGDMSIVGPRPERPEIADQYAQTLPEFALRLQVKAGLTGLAQVYGRYNTEPYNKLQMDLMYINDMSLLKDLQLILATIRILFTKESTQGVTDDRSLSGEPAAPPAKSA